jgi:hypothetical protein
VAAGNTCPALDTCLSTRNQLYRSFQDIASAVGATLEPIPALKRTGNCIIDTTACTTEAATWLAQLSQINSAVQVP